MRKRPKDPRYYACRGRVHHGQSNDSKRCMLPYVKADQLEWKVWKRVKAVLKEPDKLVECVEKALSELEDRKAQVGAEALAIDDRLETIRAKAERLGMAFADGAVSEKIYKARLNQLKGHRCASRVLGVR